MRKETKVIAFSGGCYAGKTTTIKSLKVALEADGRNVRVLDKVRYRLKNIDDIRSKPHEYLEMQEYVLRGMMTLENDAFESRTNSVILIDRPMTDALFYPLFYLDKSQLSTSELRTLRNLIADATNHLKFAYENIYDHVLFFAPIKTPWAGDFLRPTNLEELKYSESMTIDLLNKAYAKPSQYHRFDLNNESAYEIIDYIKDLLT